MPKKVSIRLDLDRDLIAKFEAIKKEYGLKTNTSVVRLIITRFYDDLTKDG